MSGLSESPAERLLEQASGDPEFEAKLRAGYHGRHDVLDALWWAAHPLTSTPRGVANPASALRDLQRAAFSRSVAETPIVDVVDPETGVTRRVPEAEHRLHEAGRKLDDDARQLADAIATVEATAAAVDDSQPEPDALPSEREARPLRKYLLPLASIVAVLAAILVFPALSGINASPDPAPTVSAAMPERVKTEIITFSSGGNVGNPMAILERAMTESDQPGIGFESSYASGSFRALPDLVGFLELYLARGEDGETVCLVAVHGDQTGMGGCVPEPGFRENGIEISGSGEHPLGVDFTILSESFTLLANGDFRYEATARTRVQEGRPEVGVPVE